MPGISQECEVGHHAACAIGLECRCGCHQHTQQLIRKGPAKADPKGGIRRNVRAKVKEALAKLPPAPPVLSSQDEATEVYNTCPKCKIRAKATDQFCRKDGTKLCLGRPCNRCEAPCEEADDFCWACGWNLGDTFQEPTDVSPAESLSPNGTPPLSTSLSTEEAPKEDPIVRLQRIAREQGLLPKETVVS
jgi:hypothetical protein